MQNERLSARTLKSLFAMSGNRCFLDGCNHVIVGPNGSIFGKVKKFLPDNARHHDKKTVTTDTHWLSPDDLVLICTNCDNRLRSKPTTLSVEDLRKSKGRHEAQYGRASIPNDAWIALQLLNQSQDLEVLRSFVVDANGSATERFLNSQSEENDAPVVIHQSAIEDDLLACAYIAYLIRRYNEFAARERNPSARFNPKTITQNLETRYKARWKQISRVQFPHVCRYLKQRIDGTTIGKKNWQKGHLSYRSYSEFLLKSHK